MSQESEKKTVTVRGVDEEAYQKIAALARESGKTVGELLSEAMRLFIASIETGAEAVMTLVRNSSAALAQAAKAAQIVRVGNVDELVVSKDDLEGIEGRVLFQNIKKLEIADDVPLELFNEKVAGIVLVDELVIPRSLNKLKVLAKAKFVKKVTVKTPQQQ